jgi:hypothetical protein
MDMNTARRNNVAVWEASEKDFHIMFRHGSMRTGCSLLHLVVS